MINVIIAGVKKELNSIIEDTLSENDSFNLISTVNSLDEAYAYVTQIAVNTIIFNPLTYDKTEIYYIEKLRKLDIKIFIVSDMLSSMHIKETISAGISGYMLNFKENLYQIISALEIIENGGMYFCNYTKETLSSIMLSKYKKYVPRTEPIRITKREKEILHFISEGFTNEEIASLLNISTRTIQTHREHLIEKFHARNSAHLVKLAIEHGLYSVRPPESRITIDK